MDRMEQNMLSPEKMLERIFYYMNQLIEEKDFNKSLVLLTDLGKTLVNSQRASFWYRDERKKKYWTMSASDSGKIVVPMGSGIIGESIENNKIILINNPYEDPRFNREVDKATGYTTKSILCIPVTNSNGDVIGAYQVINKIGDEGFDKQDIDRLKMAAAYSGKMLEAYILKEQNMIDQLTGLKNRRGFHDAYENIILPLAGEARSSVIMCDIDFFKKVNDTYGHNVGDGVLVYVSDILQKSIEDVGEAFRWGGEEFILLLPKIEFEEAIGIAEGIRKKVEQSQCHCLNVDVKVTMSFGVSSIDYEKSSVDNIEITDEKLYRAKQEGRNRVIS